MLCVVYSSSKKSLRSNPCDRLPLPGRGELPKAELGVSHRKQPFHDEQDPNKNGIELLDKNSCIVKGEVAIRDLNRKFLWNLPDEVEVPASSS